MLNLLDPGLCRLQLAMQALDRGELGLGPGELGSKVIEAIPQLIGARLGCLPALLYLLLALLGPLGACLRLGRGL